MVGYFEVGEMLVDVVICEMFEEIVYLFMFDVFVGVYFVYYECFGSVGVIYLCFMFCGMVGELIVGYVFDDGIVCMLWMMVDELCVCSECYCLFVVMCCVDDYFVGWCILFDFVYMYLVVLCFEVFEC